MRPLLPTTIDRLAITSQSDAQSGSRTIRELERLRDDNLVGFIRALRHSGTAAGAVVLVEEAGGLSANARLGLVGGAVLLGLLGLVTSRGPEEPAATTQEARA